MRRPGLLVAAALFAFASSAWAAEDAPARKPNARLHAADGTVSYRYVHSVTFSHVIVDVEGARVKYPAERYAGVRLREVLYIYSADKEGLVRVIDPAAVAREEKRLLALQKKPAAGKQDLERDLAELRQLLAKLTRGPDVKGAPVRAPRVTPPDKHLLALRAVTFVQSQVMDNPEKLPLDLLLALTKKEAGDLAEAFERDGVDPAIVTMAKDLAAVAGEYGDWLVSCKVITAKYDQQLKSDEYAALWELLIIGGAELVGEAAKRFAQRGGAGNVVATVGGVVVGEVFSGVAKHLREEVRAGRIDAAREKELLEARDKLKDSILTKQRDHALAARRLAQKHGWKAGEAGFDSTEEEEKPFTEAASDDNTRARLKVLDAWMRRRPRDPFLALRHARLAGGLLMPGRFDGKDDLRRKAGELRDLGRRCYAFARATPADGVYKKYRAALLLQAGHLMNHAAAYLNIAASGSRYGAKCPEALEAVTMWKEALEVSPDTDAIVSMRLVFAVGLGGDLKQAVALGAKAAKGREKARCPLFASNYAALCSRCGDADTAIRWLEFGVSDCKMSAGGLATDADYAHVRAEHATRVRKLTGEKE